MRKSYWRELPAKKRQIEIKTGGGLHTGLPPAEIPDGMAVSMKNLHSCSYPYLSPRPSRDTKTISPLPFGTIRFFGVIFGDTLAAVVENRLYLLADTVWQDAGEIFSRRAGRVYHADFMDYAVFADGNECKKFDGFDITDVGKSGNPDSAKFLATHAWHLFSASDTDKYLRYSAAEDIDDWSAPMDAGLELVETSRSAFAGGLTVYGGHVLYFKENAMFELYGTDPTNFSLLCLSREIGCIANDSIQEIGGVLYFLGHDGVYRYSGGALPKKISFPIQSFIEDLDYDNRETAASGTDGVRYYLSFPYAGGGKTTLVYDTRIGEWYREDDTNFVGFASLGGVLYAVDVFGTIYIFGQGAEQVAWERTSGPYYFENSLMQNWHRLYIHADVRYGASFSVELSPWSGGEGFVHVGTFTKSGQAVIEIPRRLQNAPQMRIRLSGQGEVTIGTIEIELRARRRSYM